MTIHKFTQMKNLFFYLLVLVYLHTAKSQVGWLTNHTALAKVSCVDDSIRK